MDASPPGKPRRSLHKRSLRGRLDPAPRAGDDGNGNGRPHRHLRRRSGLLLYISWLGDPSLTAGVGLATVLMFFTISINVGLMIPIGALCLAGSVRDARRMRVWATSCSLLMAFLATLVSLATLPLLPWICACWERATKPSPLPTASPDLPADKRPDGLRMAVFSAVLRARATPSAACTPPVGRGRHGRPRSRVDFRPRPRPDGAAITINIARVVYVLVAYRYVTRIHKLARRA